MAGVRVELLVVLTGTLLLLLVSVGASGWINKTQLLKFHESGQMDEPQNIISPDDSSDYDDDEDAFYEDAFSQVEGAASEDFDPLANHGFQVDAVSGPRNWASGTGGDFDMDFVDAPPRSWTSSKDGDFDMDFVDAPPRSWTSSKDGDFDMDFVDALPRSWTSSKDGDFDMDFVDAPPRSWTSSKDGDFDMDFVDAPPRSWTSSTNSTDIDVVCSEVGFQITPLTGLLSEVKVLGSSDLLSVMDVPESCGYEVNSVKNTLTVPFTGCNVKHHDGYSLQLWYVDEFGQTRSATASCEESPKSDPDLFPRASGKTKSTSKCSIKTLVPPTSIALKAHNCGVPTAERVTCGQSGISSSDCETMGCCVDSCKSACFYPMDECTGDQHFVFAIRSNSASIPVDLTKLVIPGSPHCKPVLVNDKVAIFQFKVTECGVHAYEVGQTKIYLAEVQTTVHALNLKYGKITRSDPLRFLVECRYSKLGSAHTLASVGYMVKTPSSSLPSAVLADGLYAVQLRIAKDETYSSYLPTYHQPLRLLLGKPVYLELNLKSPKPDAVILVNYCLAYPRSAKNALVLIYEGCANPYDPHGTILQVGGLPTNHHQRRFVVRAFQFMDQKTNKYLDEEIYFMCSTEVCRPAEKTCKQHCFDGLKAP